MSENNTIQIKKDLQQITDMLLLNGTLSECPGLVHGKMGIAIFFFHYAQYTNNMLFADYAMDLIDQILNQLHVNSPANYKKGIAGIGVGFDYMIRNNFLDIEDESAAGRSLSLRGNRICRCARQYGKAFP